MGDASPPDHGGRVIDGDVARQAWKEARTLEDLGELTARWGKGTLRYMPGDDDEPYEETGPIREILASINRSGFVTTTSQPGEPMDQLVKQIRTEVPKPVRDRSRGVLGGSHRLESREP